MSTPYYRRVSTFLLSLSSPTSTHTSLPFPHPQALNKKDKNKPQEAKLYSIISFVLVLILVISYPIFVTTVTFATVFGYWCQPQTSYAYYRYSPYSRYSYTYSRC